MLQTARQIKHGGQKSILQRWQKDDQYRNSLSLIGWTEEQIIEDDKDTMALENHLYRPRGSESIRHSEHWILRLNQDGPQEPLNQRPDFAQAKRECKRLHDEYVAKTQQEYRTIHRDQQVRQLRGQAFEGHEECNYYVGLRTGWRFFVESQGDLSPLSSSTNWHRSSWTTRSWNSWHSSRSDNS